MENQNEKTKLQEAGAFWIKKSKAGNSFLTGTVKSQSGEVIKVIVFKNQYKTEGSNQPDYRVYFDTSVAPGSESKNPSPDVEKSNKNTSTKSVAAPQTEEIPF
ncbi:MAG: hypothetical protein RL736_249 [Pseudomonadota bacterium]|jgi:uncharacterized protein (DUF736 family)